MKDVLVLSCGDCGQQLLLAPLRGDEPPCDACGVAPANQLLTNWSYTTSMAGGVAFTVCMRRVCMEEATGALGLPKVPSWCDCDRNLRVPFPTGV